MDNINPWLIRVFFVTKGSSGIELGLYPNFILKTPPIEFGYLSINTYGKYAKLITNKLAIGLQAKYANIMDGTLLKYPAYPRHIFGAGAMLRYILLGKNKVMLYTELGPYFNSVRLLSKKDTFQIGSVYPFVQLSVGAQLKLKNSFYLNTHFNYASPINSLYKATYGFQYRYSTLF